MGYSVACKSDAVRISSAQPPPLPQPAHGRATFRLRLATQDPPRLPRPPPVAHDATRGRERRRRVGSLRRSASSVRKAAGGDEQEIPDPLSGSPTHYNPRSLQAPLNPGNSSTKPQAQSFSTINPGSPDPPCSPMMGGGGASVLCLRSRLCLYFFSAGSSPAGRPAA